MRELRGGSDLKSLLTICVAALVGAGAAQDRQITAAGATFPSVIYGLFAIFPLEPYDDWHRQAWAAGLVLIALVLIANIAARMVLARGVSVPRG